MQDDAIRKSLSAFMVSIVDGNLLKDKNYATWEIRNQTIVIPAGGEGAGFVREPESAGSLNVNCPVCKCTGCSFRDFSDSSKGIPMGLVTHIPNTRTSRNDDRGRK